MTLAYWFAVLCLALAGRYQYRRAVADFDLLLGHASTVRTVRVLATPSRKEIARCRCGGLCDVGETSCVLCLRAMAHVNRCELAVCVACGSARARARIAMRRL